MEQYDRLTRASTPLHGSPENDHTEFIYSSFVLHDTGLSPIGNPSFEQWEEVGRFIKKAAHASTLWLGDWINFGKIKYGGKYEQAMQETGLDYGTLKNAAYTARNIELSDRSDKLSYKHHELVAPLPKDIQRQLLREAEKKRYSRRELQQRIQDVKKLQFSTPRMPEGIYSVMYADPPWDIEAMAFTKWRTPLPYPTMTLSELKVLRLPEIAEDAILFLWTTLSTLPHGLELLGFWGFLYHITITWDKGAGYCMSGFNRRTELVLVGYKGILKNVLKQEGEYIPTVFYEQRTTHSTKPVAMYEYIEDRTIGRRIELFARTARRGWTSWGNEL
jgi:N6-adenosine-specific RNA methylase IME4